MCKDELSKYEANARIKVKKKKEINTGFHARKKKTAEEDDNSSL